MSYLQEAYKHYRESRFSFWCLVVCSVLGIMIIGERGGEFVGGLIGLFIGMKLDARYSRETKTKVER